MILCCFILNVWNLSQGKCTLHSFQMCFRGYGCQSVYITPSLTPFRNSTASWMEPKLLSLDSRPALHPSFYFSLLPSVGAPSGQTSIYWGPRTDPWPCPPLMLSPLLEILPPFPLSLLPSMFHSKPVWELLFIPQDLAPVAPGAFLFILVFSLSCYKIFLIWMVIQVIANSLFTSSPHTHTHRLTYTRPRKIRPLLLLLPLISSCVEIAKPVHVPYDHCLLLILLFFLGSGSLTSLQHQYMTRNKNITRDFTGDPVVKTFPSNAEVQSLVRELRSYMPRGQKKKKNKT